MVGDTGDEVRGHIERDDLFHIIFIAHCCYDRYRL
jgi:hypothetical protein